MKNKLIITAALFISFFIRVGGTECADLVRDNEVRIRVFDSRDSLRLSLKDRYTIYEVATGKVLMEGPHLTAEVRPSTDGMDVGEARFRTSGVKISIDKDADIQIEKKRFRGDVDILKRPDGKLMAVNHIDVEKYLYGVLIHEVNDKWPMEVLKAQAIAARTFALYQAAQTRSKPYDLTGDVYSQVYGGVTAERWSTVRAVDLTKGEVLKFKGRIFPAYFHAVCAGITENAANLWRIDLEPLRGGVLCPHCRTSPHYIWHREILLKDVGKKLASAGYGPGDVRSVKCVGRNRSGRVEKVEIKFDNGKISVIPAKDLRLIVGPNEFRSTRFTAKVKWNKLVLDGFGWGHGVGMCQWGAYGLAKAGKTAGEILKFYYPGSEISSIEAL